MRSLEQQTVLKAVQTHMGKMRPIFVGLVSLDFHRGLQEKPVIKPLGLREV